MKEAILYQKLDDGKVRCAVCGHRCTIAEGRRGICGVRENQGGSLYTLNYGVAVSVAIDPIEKKPLYHFMPGTKTYSFAAAGCNLCCAWCQNWEISQGPKPDKPIEGYEVHPKEHVRQALAHGCPSISYTYSEPTIFVEYALDTMILAQKEGLKNIWVTNGFMSPETLERIIPYLDAANVDLKGSRGDVYEKYCCAHAEPIMESLKILHQAGVHLEVTTLVVPGVNDRPEQLKEVAEFVANELSRDVPWHISRFFPAWKMMDVPVTPIETLRMAQAIGKDAGLKHIHLGNVH